MQSETGKQAKSSLPEKPLQPFTQAVKELTRTERLMFAVVLFFYLVLTACFIVSWRQHNAGLQMQVSGLGMSVLYLVCIWHSVRVMGGRRTAAFFALAAALSFFAEYMGSNYNWFFGEYDYTASLGPRVGGVPPLIVIVWGVVLYAAFMLVNWLLELGGQWRRARGLGRVFWCALVAFTVGIIACAWDLMADPFAVSRVWMDVLGWEPWWWWTGGVYLKELAAWQGAGGVPLQNFVGWVEVPFAIIFIFCLFFARPGYAGRPDHAGQPGLPAPRLVDAIPLLIYGYMYYTLLGALLVMNWYDPGLNQAAMIGTFTMGPVILLGVVKLCRDYWGGD